MLFFFAVVANGANYFYLITFLLPIVIPFNNVVKIHIYQKHSPKSNSFLKLRTNIFSGDISFVFYNNFFLRIGHITIVCDDFFNESKEKVDDKLLRPQYMWGRRMIMFYCNVLY